jgi:hypothetical protein
MFPPEAVLQEPVARISKQPLVSPAGGAIVTIVAVPERITIGAFGAMVAAEAIVSVAAFPIAVLETRASKMTGALCFSATAGEQLKSQVGRDAAPDFAPTST